MARRDIVVVGASAGGIEALQQLVAALPPGFSASVFVVWHMPSELRQSVLPEVLAKAGPLPAARARDGERIEPGRIYVAQPDHHLMLEKGAVRVTKGPKENRFRPAVDPLFRSAAYVYGTRVVGVVLSGALDDGTSGLWTIKLRGGMAIVQDPAEARQPSMPRSALEAVAVDYTLRAAQIGALLGTLTQEAAPPAPEISMDETRKTQVEVRVAAAEARPPGEGAAQLGEWSPFTCPECHGVLARIREGSLLRFRCHTGHALTGNALLSATSEQIEMRLWDALRAVDETVMLLQHLGKHLREAGDEAAAGRYFEQARAAQEQAEPIRGAALRSAQVDPSALRDAP